MDYQKLLQAASFTPKRIVFPYAWGGGLPFASWIISELKPKVFVELGIDTGNFYLTFCQTVDVLNLDTKCYAVDTRQGEEYIRIYDNKIYDELKKYHDPLYSKFSKLICKSFDQALVDFNDKSINFLHINGFHSYEAIKHAFKSWLPKLADNAVVLFHGEFEQLEELRLEYDMVLNFQYLHNLGILQLSSNNDINKLPWLAPQNKDKIIQYFEALGENILSKQKLEQSIQDEIACIAELEVEIKAMKRTVSWRITRPLRLIRRILSKIKKVFSRKLLCSSRNYDAHMQIVSKRCTITEAIPTVDPMTAKLLTNPPSIDISVVTYNSSKWIGGFIDSLANVNYPPSKIFLYFVDNNSSDDTIKQLRDNSKRLVSSGVTVNIIESSSNKGFGAGHNIGINTGKSKFCLVTNIDLTFDPNAIIRIVSTACADVPEIAAWELRQKPYEHPKFYDPVTGLTNWNSHACVLISRSAFENVGGYDEEIFMYGEDVELSYRFRQKGYLLRYNPIAIVYHYTYTTSKEVKPLQYVGSIFGNFYIRLKYGNYRDILAIPFMMRGLLSSPEAFKGAHRNLRSNFTKLIKIAPKVIINRPIGSNPHPFRAFDYDMARQGAFIELPKLEGQSLPLVSIITRTYKGRELLIKQALLSAAHQTYPLIEHIVVQDGGDSVREAVEEIAKVTGHDITFIGLKKCGRSAAGNAGLAAAKGKWCLFLDDDDLLFCDHVETLVAAIIKNPGIVASYSLAWEIKTNLVEKNMRIKGYTEVITDIPTVIRQNFSQKILLHTNYLPIQSVLFERNLFEMRGGFDEDIDILEDWLLWNRYAKDNTFAYIEKCTSMYRTPYNSKKLLKRNNAFIEAKPIVQERIKLLQSRNFG